MAMQKRRTQSTKKSPMAHRWRHSIACCVLRAALEAGLQSVKFAVNVLTAEIAAEPSKVVPAEADDPVIFALPLHVPDIVKLLVKPAAVSSE